MKSGVRESTPSDAPGIAKLLAAANLRTNAAPGDLTWKYWEPREDWPGSRSFVVESGGEILAHAGVVPGTLLFGARRAVITHMVDWASRPDAPGAGVLVLKHVRRLSDCMLGVGGSEHTLKLLPSLGFRPYGTAGGYARTLHPLQLLRPSVYPAWQILPRFVRGAVWSAATPRDAAQDWSARLLGPARTGELAAVLPRPTDTLAVMARSASTLRHISGCPITPAEVYAIDHAGVTRGYFVLTFAPGQARLADCWVDSSDPAHWRALVHGAVREARRRPNTAELVAWANDPWLSSALLECGFRLRHALPVQLLAGPEVLPSSVVPRVQMLDSDAAYLHPGMRAFWA
jgi:hypothetical protein